ncbi:hypothetical protein BUE76_01985 [Cnuella takakiae]|nr:hypothetical protein BUE76_01985 [Cnuella takakiae]
MAGKTLPTAQMRIYCKWFSTSCGETVKTVLFAHTQTLNPRLKPWANYLLAQIQDDRNLYQHQVNKTLLHIHEA